MSKSKSKDEPADDEHDPCQDDQSRCAVVELADQGDPVRYEIERKFCVGVPELAVRTDIDWKREEVRESDVS
jgi:hypothetical protein